MKKAKHAIRQHDAITDTIARKERIKLRRGIKRRKIRRTVDAINLKKASLSLADQFKPIHELECNGIVTQDPTLWVEETYEFGTTSFGNPNNNNNNNNNNDKQPGSWPKTTFCLNM